MRKLDGKQRAVGGHGGKSDFRAITVTLPPTAYEGLIRESTRRKIAREPNQLLSALLREAVNEYLNRIEGLS